MIEMTEIQPSVVYRTGPLVREDYDEAIEYLIAAREQLEPTGDNCAVCGDSGHSPFQCHHNPLVMARRAVAEANSWRCFHCGGVFVDELTARLHFGDDPSVPAACRTRKVYARGKT